MQAFEQWKATRQQDMLAPQGDASLIAMHAIKEAMIVPEVPGTWTPTTDAPGLTVRATAADGLKINGQLVDGSYDVIAYMTVVEAADGRTMMATNQPESNHLLAVWDTSCEARKNYVAIDTYMYNEAAVFEGQLVQHAEQTFSFTHTSDQAGTREHASIGEIVVDIAGETYRLRPFAAGAYSIIVFRDSTSGADTYGTGRMLVIEPDVAGHVKLDFNYAFLPPCAFSPHFNCPMPPFSNRLKTAISAGEKNVLWQSVK
ncbi:DUF1684 domain-containing protein [Kurthia huakuii]|uniref:DUF1684 domain-containing protein n=1 Tax=Kurthia huakuii TaxID=1421019 RepID=UPI0004971417|nr:DUF1684 domain-containing protein [Kurthia huakuii]MBM7699903.1 uncharacterized protein (DUF1684 family) [Kurthia huakuii]